jgi:hypothetical protein
LTNTQIHDNLSLVVAAKTVRFLGAFTQKLSRITANCRVLSSIAFSKFQATGQGTLQAVSDKEKVKQ